MIYLLIPLFTVLSALATPPCDITVGFGSYCCGINSVQYEKVTSYLRSQESELTFEEDKRGREGEREFCIHVLDPKMKSQHLAKLKKISKKNISDKPSAQVSE